MVKSDDEVFLYLLKFFLSTTVQGVLSFSLRFHALFFTGVISLYSPILFNPNLSLVDHVGDLLDACPIRYLLEAL